MFTFKKKGVPVAQIVDGKLNGKVIAMDESIKAVKATTNVADNRHIPDQLNYKSKTCPYCEHKFTREDCVKRHIATSCRVKLLQQLMNKVAEPVESKKFKMNEDFKSFVVEDGKLMPLPNIKDSEVLFVAGPRNSGKSTYAAKYAEAFQNIFPKKQIILFSEVKNDPKFDVIDNLIRIPIDDNLLEDPIDINEELNDSLLIFDDIDKITNSKLQKYILKLIENIAANGRDHAEKGKDIYMLITMHLLTDYKTTRGILNDATSITVFPHSGSAGMIERLFKKYYAIDDEIIKRVIKTQSRWVTFHKVAPQYMIDEHQVYLLN